MPLSPAITEGTALVGEARLALSERRQVGGVEAYYDPSAWLGTMENGQRRPALALVIDRAEVGEHGPSGAHEVLAAGKTFQSFIGPYRIEGRASAEDPPRSVTIHVERRACPDHAESEPPTGSVWMWLSTEALRVHTIDVQGQMLQISLSSSGQAPELQVSSLGWRQAILPEPGKTRSFRIDGRIVTIEQIVPGRETRFDGAWHSQGPARLSALVRVDRAPTTAPEPALAPPTACGSPANSRSRLPVELAKAPLQRGKALKFSAGERHVIEGIPLQMTVSEPPVPRSPVQKRGPPLVQLSSLSPAEPLSVSFISGGDRARFGRAKRVLLRVDPFPDGRAPTGLSVQTFPLACAREAPAMPQLSSATYVWLSTIGQSVFSVGPVDNPELKVQLDTESDDPSLAASSPHAYDSRPLVATLVGHVASLDDYRIEVSDFVADEHTHPAGSRWTADNGVPALHVQLRITHE